MNRLKGQISVYDALIALAVFSMLYFALDSMWNDKLQSLQQLQMENEMQFRALQAVSVMLKSPGVPYNWEKNPNDANAIGLVSKSGELRKEKLKALAAMDYNTAQFVLKVAPYNFRLEFDANGTSDDLAIGKSIDANASVITIERAAKFSGGTAIVTFKVFN